MTSFIKAFLQVNLGLRVFITTLVPKGMAYYKDLRIFKQTSKMKTSIVFEMRADEFNNKLAEILKAIPEFKQPEWSLYVKSGTSKKRPPQSPDFWYKRAASILRQVYLHNVVGVNRLRTRYGSRKNRGVKPEKFRRSSGKIIRTILQQADSAGLLEKYNVSGKRAGRRLTDKGKSLLEGIK